MIRPSTLRIAGAIVLAAATVTIVAALLPRSYFANDDIGLTAFLREDTRAPWMSAILSQALCAAYARISADVPWYGLYLYGVLTFTLAVLLHLVAELIAERRGAARAMTAIVALPLVITFVVIVLAITWTTVAIVACGVALAAFLASLLAGRASWPRALAYGLLLAAGLMLRPQGLQAALVGVGPLLAWACWRLVRTQSSTSWRVLAALAGPSVVSLLLQGTMPQARDPDVQRFEKFNDVRGLINGHAAFASLHRRAPELLTQAGWTRLEYRNFSRWMILDEEAFSVAKLERLVATGGKPMTFDEVRPDLEQSADESAATLYLFGALAIAALALAAARRDGLSAGFVLGYGALMVVVPIHMATHTRFPVRVALPMFFVAGLGVLLHLILTLPEQPARSRRRTIAGALALIALTVVPLTGWASAYRKWIDPKPSHALAEYEAFDQRVAARGGFVFVYGQDGLVDLDPLRPSPRAYAPMLGGWGTFSVPFYRALARLGVHRAADMVPAMIDNPDAYLVANIDREARLLPWLQSLGGSHFRLKAVDAAQVGSQHRPALFRLISVTPPTPGTPEWDAMMRDEELAARARPPAPDVSHLRFLPVTIDPAADHSGPRQGARNVEIVAIDGGVRVTLVADDLRNAVHQGGVVFAVTNPAAVRFQLTLLDPASVASVHVIGAGKARPRWIWTLNDAQRQLGFTGPVVLTPGTPSGPFVSKGDPTKELFQLSIVVMIEDGSTARFELRDLEVAEPATGKPPG